MEKPFAITLDPGSSLANRTGSWRTSRPVYVDRLPPCNKQCPAGEDIHVQLRGGVLTIRVLPENQLLMTGAAETVCEGTTNV